MPALVVAIPSPTDFCETQGLTGIEAGVRGQEN